MAEEMAAEPGWVEWTDTLGDALKEIIAGVMPQETEWDEEKLEKKLREYFRKAAKGLETWKSWDQLFADYCDTAFSSIFCSLGDREWLAQADFLLAVDAGIKEAIPKKKLTKVPKADFEKAVLSSYEKAWEYQRFSPICWEATKEFVTGPKTTSKVRTAFEEGREAGAAGAVEGEGADAWVERWIDCSIKKLAEATHGYMDGTLEAEVCQQFVTRMIENGAVPPSVLEAGAPDMSTVAIVVTSSYENHGCKEGEENKYTAAAAKKAKKKAGAGDWDAAPAAAAWGAGKGGAGAWGGGGYGAAAFGGYGKAEMMKGMMAAKGGFGKGAFGKGWGAPY